METSPIDKTLELYLFLRGNVGWFSQKDLSSKLKFDYDITGFYLGKLNKHGLVNWVIIGKRTYYFVPRPASGGTHTYLAELATKIYRETGGVYFEDLGMKTGHGPRTLEQMIKSLEINKKLGWNKDFPDIKIPEYKTDEPNPFL